MREASYYLENESDEELEKYEPWVLVMFLREIYKELCDDEHSNKNYISVIKNELKENKRELENSYDKIYSLHEKIRLLENKNEN